MIPIQYLREHADEVKENLKTRKDPSKIQLVDDVLKKDQEYRTLLQQEEELRKQRNTITRDINAAKKAGNDTTELLKQAKELPQKVKDLTHQVDAIKKDIKDILFRIPNLLHESVPYGKDDSENQEIKKWGEPKKTDFELKAHGQVAEDLNLADFETAGHISGKGFYYLFGDLARLEMALQQYAIEALNKKGFTIAQVPLMMRREPYEGVTDLSDFETMMYKIEDEDLYLIATSEHAIGALYKDKILDPKELPIKVAGVSACFRKEIGSHGVDERGLFRVHQFNKVEQFVFCNPTESWEIHEQLLANAEELLQALELPYRVVNICTGDIGSVAAKKYDVEVFMPREQAYKEVVSCSNCTAYQAARLNIKLQQTKEFIHTLNSTAIATSRILRAILEVYQNKDGTVTIPSVLQPYLGGLKTLAPSTK